MVFLDLLCECKPVGGVIVPTIIKRCGRDGNDGGCDDDDGSRRVGASQKVYLGRERIRE